MFKHLKFEGGGVERAHLVLKSGFDGYVSEGSLEYGDFSGSVLRRIIIEETLWQDRSRNFV